MRLSYSVAWLSTGSFVLARDVNPGGVQDANAGRLGNGLIRSLWKGQPEPHSGEIAIYVKISRLWKFQPRPVFFKPDVFYDFKLLGKMTWWAPKLRVLKIVHSADHECFVKFRNKLYRNDQNNEVSYWKSNIERHEVVAPPDTSVADLVSIYCRDPQQYSGSSISSQIPPDTQPPQNPKWQRMHWVKLFTLHSRHVEFYPIVKIFHDAKRSGDVRHNEPQNQNHNEPQNQNHDTGNLQSPFRFRLSNPFRGRG